MTDDGRSSEGGSPSPAKKARARKLVAEPDRVAALTDDPPPAGAAEPALVEPALTLPVSEPSPRGSLGAGIAAFATVLLIGGSVYLLQREPRYPDVAPAAPPAMVKDAPSAPSAPSSIAAAPAASEPATAPALTAAPTQVAGSAVAAISPPPPPAPPAPRAAVAGPRISTLSASRPAPPPQLDAENLCASLPAAARARCLYRPLDDADARLADAFDNAVEAGVPWPVLRRYRTAWDGLRSRASSNPAAVASTYSAMAEELDDLTARAFGPG